MPLNATLCSSCCEIDRTETRIEIEKYQQKLFDLARQNDNDLLDHYVLIFKICPLLFFILLFSWHIFLEINTVGLPSMDLFWKVNCTLPDFCHAFTDAVRVEIRHSDVADNREFLKQLKTFRDKTQVRSRESEIVYNQLRHKDIEIAHSAEDRELVIWMWCKSSDARGELEKLQKSRGLNYIFSKLLEVALGSLKTEHINIDWDCFQKETGKFIYPKYIEFHIIIPYNCKVWKNCRCLLGSPHIFSGSAKCKIVSCDERNEKLFQGRVQIRSCDETNQE